MRRDRSGYTRSGSLMAYRMYGRLYFRLFTAIDQRLTVKYGRESWNCLISEPTTISDEWQFSSGRFDIKRTLDEYDPSVYWVVR